MVDSTDTRPYVFAILQYKRSCLYLLNKDYRRKLNRLRTPVEDWRVDIYKWESCCFTGFRFSVPSRVKRELGVDWIGECRRVVQDSRKVVSVGSEKVEGSQKVVSVGSEKVEGSQKMVSMGSENVKGSFAKSFKVGGSCTFISLLLF